MLYKYIMFIQTNLHDELGGISKMTLCTASSPWVLTQRYINRT